MVLLAVAGLGLAARTEARGLASPGASPHSGAGSAADPYADQPLDDLDPRLSAFIASRQGVIGVAVVVPGRGVTYSWNGDQPFALASIAKVHIMLALLQAVASEGRELTEDEGLFLDWMIRISDNESASILWDLLGSGGGVLEHLSAFGLPDLQMPNNWEWGTSTQPARGAAGLFARLLNGDGLDPASRDLALDLLYRVDSSQRWGITAGLDWAVEDRPLLFMKDGWYPDDEEGWRVNSAGIIIPLAGEPYVLVIFTTANESYDYGVETIEGIASLINAALAGGTPLAYALQRGPAPDESASQ